MNRKIRIWSGILVVVTMAILISNLVLGLGITPGRTSINFEPNLRKNVSFSIINSESEEMSVVFYVSGDLNNSIILNQRYAEFSSGENSKSFSYEVNLPGKFENPGLHKGKVTALQMPKDLKKRGTFVGATLSVSTQLYVYVPYPGKYVEIDSNIVNTYENGEVVFLIPIISRGKLGIDNVKAVIDVYNPGNEKIASIETLGKTLNSGERKELIGKWEANVNPGKYFARITVIYDGESKETEKEFKIGDRVLEIQKIEVNDFSLGGIAKFNALVENKYNQEVRDAYLNLKVYNEEEEVMADIKSQTYNLEALSKKNMVAYWDTKGVKEGDYEGKLFLKHSEGSFDREVKVKVSENDIIVQGLSGEVLIEKMKESNFKAILIYAIIILVILNIVWFIVVRKLFLKKK